MAKISIENKTKSDQYLIGKFNKGILLKVGKSKIDEKEWDLVAGGPWARLLISRGDIIVYSTKEKEIKAWEKDIEKGNFDMEIGGE